MCTIVLTVHLSTDHPNWSESAGQKLADHELTHSQSHIWRQARCLKHWRAMVGSYPHLKDAFPLPPLVAYRRPQNIRDKIVRSKIPGTPIRAKRIIPGMKKCNNCIICPFVRESKTVQSTASKCTVEINRPVNCQTRNILYCITCTKYSLQYIGESERSLKDRFSEHKGYVVNNKLTKATGEHFNQK